MTHDDIQAIADRCDARARRQAVVSWVMSAIIFISLFAVGLLWWQTSHEQAHQNAALCTFTADLKRRVARTEAFLDAIPGPVVFGLPRATTEQSVRNQRLTILSLASLRC